MHTMMDSRNALITLLTLFAGSALGQPTVTWYTFDGGGACPSEPSVGGSFELSGTLGQPDAGLMTGGTYSVLGGFWAVEAAPPPQPGDCDADGDVDLSDYEGLPECLTGPGGGLQSAACGCFDLDPAGADADVDLIDFAEFQVAFAAPGA